jgi:hypothetical protein
LGAAGKSEGTIRRATAAASFDLLLALIARTIVSRSAKPLQNRRIQVLDEKNSSTLVA